MPRIRVAAAPRWGRGSFGIELHRSADWSGRDNPKSASLVNLRIMSATRKHKSRRGARRWAGPENVRGGTPFGFPGKPGSVALSEPPSRMNP